MLLFNRLSLSAALLGLCVLVPGCATQESKDAAYDRALAPWQGVSEETLRARWGQPTGVDDTGNGRWLTYIVDAPGGDSPRFTIGIGGFGMGSHVGAGGGVVAPVGNAGGHAQRCTTRFLIEDGKVSSWTYDGPGCGAAP